MKASFNVVNASVAEYVQDSDLGLSLRRLEWAGNGVIVLDEPPIEIDESKEALEFLNGSGYGPIPDGGYLPLVHPYTILIDVVP